MSTTTTAPTDFVDVLIAFVAHQVNESPEEARHELFCLTTHHRETEKMRGAAVLLSIAEFGYQSGALSKFLQCGPSKPLPILTDCASDFAQRILVRLATHWQRDNDGSRKIVLGD